MEDSDFLLGYDLNAYDRPSIAVDCVVLGMVDGRLSAFVSRRDRPPFTGCWALPGGFVGIDESLDAAASRVLADKAGIRDVAVEQVQAFGAVDRDPRMRIVAIGYRALLTPVQIAAIPTDDARCLAPIDPDGRVEGRTLAFDHADIVRVTLDQLRATIDIAAFALLPDRFTLRALQQMHEAVLGRTLNKPAFRRRMLERGDLIATGDFEAGQAFRPAELYTRTAKD